MCESAVRQWDVDQGYYWMEYGKNRSGNLMQLIEVTEAPAGT